MIDFYQVVTVIIRKILNEESLVTNIENIGAIDITVT